MLPQLLLLLPPAPHTRNSSCLCSGSLCLNYAFTQRPRLKVDCNAKPLPFTTAPHCKNSCKSHSWIKHFLKYYLCGTQCPVLHCKDGRILFEVWRIKGNSEVLYVTFVLSVVQNKGFIPFSNPKCVSLQIPSSHTLRRQTKQKLQ